ncbi:hypothetical protein TanjilG_16856 [Lupinus angustifolius]|uniref:Longin domain-containing protein n=1 Tax=Lupinus angustifolius TaxID=3871 RepID=A0A1J7GCB5_LUPAN|nr:PREDICTED: phytolongin Phyl2.2-like [Lupinus angustifolius]OIV98019.1 hypothetical protein TanjilG_16856 [Lupinus angustifolius]
MISNPELIYYACIAKQTTILAQHNNTNDPKIESLASQCIQLTPPNHSIFSHTHKNRTFTFLIDTPFTFFAIFNNQTLKSETLIFLDAVKTAFRNAGPEVEDSNDLQPLCFQSQFESILKRTLNLESESSGNSTNSIRSWTVPLLGKPVEGLKKKKRVVGSDGNSGIEGKDGNLENKLEVSDSEVSVCNRQKAKHIWKKHVWVVLLLDLFVCAILFVVWLLVCSGFKCMA